jgi:hypothetical protein
MQLMETVLGREHPDTLTSMNNLAIAFESKCAKGESIHKQTLKPTETVLGKDHPDTLTSMNSLSLALEKQGMYAEAEAIHIRALQLY